MTEVIYYSYFVCVYLRFMSFDSHSVSEVGRAGIIYYTWSEKLNGIFGVTQTADFGFLVQNSLKSWAIPFFLFNCLWSWIRELRQCVAPVAGVVSITRKIKMRLMRFLFRHPGWPSSCPWRADGQRENVALRAKAEHNMGSDDKSNWTQSSIKKNCGVQRDRAATLWLWSEGMGAKSPVRQLLTDFVSNAASPAPI